MKERSRFWIAFGVVLAGLAATPALVLAQTATTGAISGLVADESGGVLPGATVTAVHEPTGTRYTATTGGDGRFNILNVRVGGPYAVTVSLSGFQDRQIGKVTVGLGEDRHLSFTLAVAAIEETVEVTAEVGTIISPSANGPASNVAQQTIETLPTVARAIQDFARLSPYFVSDGESGSQDALSVAGRNNRYNNIQIDGAVNNDLFGLASSGTPGGQTETQPISLDAIQELQLVVSPYDVRQGGFTGGGVNAVTKSGSNSFHGTGYYYFRSEAFVGDGPNETPIATFDDKQYGGSLGGPIAKDRAFFFVNVDWGRKDTPSGYSADGASGQDFGRSAEVDRFLSILQNEYGYDPGGTAEFIRGTNSNKVFARLDFNLNATNRLTLRHNYVKSDNDIGFPSSRSYYFPDNFYLIRDTTNSTVAQLNSTWGSLTNELRLTYQTVRDKRDGATRFPFVLVDLADGAQLRAGREQFSTANELDQDIFELHDELTFQKGNHMITVGTHNEFFKFRNLFIRDNFGSYRFSSLDNLERGLAQSYDYSFSATSDPQQSAEFKVNQIGFFAGDQWRVAPSFTLTLGLRVDIPSFPDKPTANPAAEALFGYATDVAPSPTMWSPRLGFNWDIGGEGKRQLRGGAGFISGRTPYVWLSNQYGNTGIEFTRIGASFNASNNIPFVADPDNQPTVVVGASGRAFANEVDVVDPDYKFPSVLRASVAYDQELGFFGLTGTAELFYSSVVNDIDYANLNKVATGTRPDGRPLFGSLDRNYSDVILLRNTDKGNDWTVLFKLERPWRDGLYAMASYLYGEANNVNEGTSSQAASNWGNNYIPGDPNNSPVAPARYAAGHRLTLALSKDFDFGPVSLTVGGYYEGKNGRPYSFNVNGDWNGDGRTGNDLLYVPASEGEVIIRNGTWADLDAYIEADDSLSEFRGQIIERNAGRSPWTDRLDLSTLITVPIKGVKLQYSLVLQNFLNLLNKDWGVVDYATFNDLNPVRVSLDQATGQMVYDIGTLTSPTYVKFDRDDLRSRWQAQMGFRLLF
jgi:hypothetical protein